MNGAALCMLSHPFPAECLPACSTSSLPVPNALLLRSLVISVLAEKDWISFSLLGKQSITLAGNQVGDAEIQEPSASHSKTRLSQSTKALSLGLMVSAKTLTKQHFFFISFFSGASSLPLALCKGNPSLFSQGKASMGLSFPLSLLLSVSFRAGEWWSRWLATTAFLPQGKKCNLTTSQNFPSW